MKFIFKVFRTLFSLLITFILFWVLFTNIVANGQVQGHSMEPTLTENNRVLGLRRKTPKRGDLIVFRAPDNLQQFYIKRVIGVPGDLISYKNDVLYINGQPKKEPYLDAAKEEYYEQTNKLFTPDFTLFKQTGRSQVPLDSYFVMGDNRQNSTDSRSFGFVKESLVQSVVVLKYYPLSEFKFY